ncbi:MAG: DUF1648 domain-containing protein [Dehalococcoidales bacterium]|jgi:uncharacterized membrane protein|nr:DUF1648 domain-containing protein [Dehalococcoidales bacterium]
MMGKNTAGVSFGFKWSDIILPLAVLLLALVLAVVFYSRLPDEVAYRFQSDGSPGEWAGRGVVVLWTLLPQMLLALAAGAITWGMTRLASRFIQPKDTRVKPRRIIALMGNMIALPQIILGFAMLDIFLYNSNQVHLLPLWVFTLITMVAGGIILSISFVRAIGGGVKVSKE